MDELQALITGAIAGALMRQDYLDIDVAIQDDGKGNFTNEILVTGRQSGMVLRVTVEQAYDTPESVAQKMQAGADVLKAAQKHLS